MSTIRTGAATIAAAALFSLAFGGATGTAAEAPKAGGSKPAIFNLFGSRLVEPKEIFLTANSGPYLDDITWSKWDKGGARGSGTYVSECASCGPPRRLDAKIRATRAARCAKKGGKAFRTVKYTVTRENGSQRTLRYPAAVSLYCKKD